MFIFQKDKAVRFSMWLRCKNVQEPIIASAATIRIGKEKRGWKGKVWTETLQDSAFFLSSGTCFWGLSFTFPISSLKMIIIWPTQWRRYIFYSFWLNKASQYSWKHRKCKWYRNHSNTFSNMSICRKRRWERPLAIMLKVIYLLPPKQLALTVLACSLFRVLLHSSFLKEAICKLLRKDVCMGKALRLWSQCRATPLM